MGTVHQYKISSGAADGSGDATSTSEPIYGKLKAVHVVYDATSAATTDVTLELVGSNVTEGADLTLLSLVDANTSRWVQPRTPMEDTAGADVTYDGTNEIYTEFTLYGNVKLTVADQTTGKGVTVYLIVEN